MFTRFRSARPSHRLGELRRFYVDGLGCTLLSAWVDHEGYDGLVVGDPGGDPKGLWQVEFVHRRDQLVPSAPSTEHQLVFYVKDRAALAARVEVMARAGFEPVASTNPYWQRFGVTFADPDGYLVVLAVPHGL